MRLTKSVHSLLVSQEYANTRDCPHQLRRAQTALELANTLLLQTGRHCLGFVLKR
ncbi:Uncharacterised protein [Vibrio cholerae]|uniref:Uncharacterized protein n=1 Tax=Vibrio cholerae TaxID=666 RepID=A0A655XDW2_VIBCL|nr:Uncharacterised protein [Vibrio cholerae]